MIYRIELVDQNNKVIKVLGKHAAFTQTDVNNMLDMYSDDADKHGEPCQVQAVEIGE